MMATATATQAPFTWEGTDRTGKKVKGKVVSTSEAAVRSELRRQGVVPSRVRKQSMLFRKQGKVTAADIAIFSRQLATMMTAGIPLVQSFDIVGAGHENPAMQKLILAIKSDVENGTALADALAKHPLHFDDLFVSLVAAGEQAGALETLLDKIATYKEKTEAIKKKIKKALFYPAAVVVVAIVVTVILMIYVIPEFESLFQGFGADLPAPDEVRAFYLDLGYDVPVVTNYQSIHVPSGPGIPLTGYEHGFNPGQRHQTVLNASDVSFFDVPLYQGLPAPLPSPPSPSSTASSTRSTTRIATPPTKRTCPRPTPPRFSAPPPDACSSTSATRGRTPSCSPAARATTSCWSAPAPATATRCGGGWAPRRDSPCSWWPAASAPSATPTPPSAARSRPWWRRCAPSACAAW
jgi:hypothetical protein